MPPEVQEQDWAEYLKFENQWVYNNEMVYYKYKTIFDTADADSDGQLSAEEYYAFETALYNQRVASYGGFFEWSQDELDQWWEALNTITPDVPGISLHDYHR